MDRLSEERRSWNMSRIRDRDTKPEMIVRRLVHTAGFHYRLHVRDLAGCPDLVFPRLRKVIFVHGCFWHRHRCANGQVMPETRAEFWKAKFEGNTARDSVARQQLRREGWKVLVVWECETRVRNLQRLQTRVVRFLRS
jgi:DNA mismatch endonuclease, patch repair protein